LVHPETGVGTYRDRGWYIQRPGLVHTETGVGTSRDRGWYIQRPGLVHTETGVGTSRFAGFVTVYERLVVKCICTNFTDWCLDREGQRREFHSGDGVRSQSNEFVIYDLRSGNGKVFCPSIPNLSLPLSFQDRSTFVCPQPAVDAIRSALLQLRYTKLFTCIRERERKRERERERLCDVCSRTLERLSV